MNYELLSLAEEQREGGPSGGLSLGPCSPQLRSCAARLACSQLLQRGLALTSPLLLPSFSPKATTVSQQQQQARKRKRKATKLSSGTFLEWERTDVQDE